MGYGTPSTGRRPVPLPVLCTKCYYTGTSDQVTFGRCPVNECDGSVTYQPTQEQVMHAREIIRQSQLKNKEPIVLEDV